MWAIVTLDIGDNFRHISDLTHPYIRKYANRIGAEFIVFGHQKYAHCHFDKFRIYDILDHFDRVLYMDSDILVHPECPNLFELVPESCVGIYDESKPADEQQKRKHRDVMKKAIHIYGTDTPPRYGFYNAGLYVVSKHHQSLFTKPDKTPFMEYGDQPLLNLRLLHSDYDIYDIGFKFNRMPYLDEKINEPRTDSYMIHYAGLTKVVPELLEDINLLYPDAPTKQWTPSSRILMLQELKLEGKKCVEVGTYKGDFAKKILECDPKDLWLIDPWENQPLDIYPSDYANASKEQFDKMYKDALKLFEDDRRVHILRDYSLDAAQKFMDESLDFVYLDAVHTTESVLMDMTAWWSKVKPGGWLCGHDYTGIHQGVKVAVDHFCRISRRRLNMLALESWASWGIHKDEKDSIYTQYK